MLDKQQKINILKENLNLKHGNGKRKKKKKGGKKK